METRDAYVALPGEEQLDAARPVDHPYNFGFPTAMGRVLMAHPRIGPAFQAMFAAIMFEPGALERPEREMVAAVAASAQYCHY
jgi:alkylhydroperoxidase family enzyme